MDEYNIYVNGGFVETSTKDEIMKTYNLTETEFQSKIGTKNNHGFYFKRIHKQNTKNMPDSLIKDWDETMQKIRDRVKNKKKRKKFRIK